MNKKQLLEELKSIQQEHGYLKEEKLIQLSKKLGIPLSEIYGTASFYSFLYTEPRGKYKIKVCENLSCRVNGSEDILKEIKEQLGIGIKETTKDGKFFLETTSCLGRCDGAPAMIVNEKVYTRLDREKVGKILKGLR